MTTRNYDSSDLTRLIRDRVQFNNFQMRVTAQNSAAGGIYVRGINPQTGNTADSLIDNLSNGDYTTYYRAFPTTVISVPCNMLCQSTTTVATPVPDPSPDTTSFIYSFDYAGSDPVLIPVKTSGGTGTLTISSSYVQVGTTYTVTVSLVSFIDNQTSTKGISFNLSTPVNDFYKVIPVTIQQFGSIPLSREGSVFAGLTKLTISPTTIPVILPNTSFGNLFLGCTDFNSDISAWDTTNVTYMSSTFQSATAFNQPIGTWNTSAVLDMQSMFRVASAFNQPIGDWNTAAVTNMQAMFDRASAFNQNISYQDGTPKWDTSGVTNMASMFNSATVFNNGQGAGGNSARLNWRTTGITPPVSNFRASSALTAENSENSAGLSNWY